jgi:hypothetical protein
MAFLAAISLCLVGVVRAEYGIWERGDWPESWPKEMEPLRKQARTLEGPAAPDRYYLIPFTKREEFETAWPHLLKAKSKGAPIILVRGPRAGLLKVDPAGVMIKSPPEVPGQVIDPSPRPGNEDVRTKWINAIYIELVVDGKIVDLNRIPLPADSPIVDERFKEEKAK